jgi:AcrR family transcriptional regulator
MYVLVPCRPSLRTAIVNQGQHFEEPRQERSRRTLRRIVRAARELVAEQGADATSVQQIVQRAESSVGSFYARFGGKEDLFDYIEQSVWEEARHRWERALEERSWETLPLSELTAGVVQILLDVGRHEARVRRALLVRRSASGATTTPAEDFQTEVRHGLQKLLLSHTSELTAPDPERAVDLGLRIVVGGLRELQAAADLSDEEIVQEVSRLLLAYLGSAASRKPTETSDRIDFFDVWG